MGESGALARRRASQAREWMWAEIGETLTETLKAHPNVAGRLAGLERKVQDGRITPTAAARAVIAAFLGAEKRRPGQAEMAARAQRSTRRGGPTGSPCPHRGQPRPQDRQRRVQGKRWAV